MENVTHDDEKLDHWFQMDKVWLQWISRVLEYGQKTILMSSIRHL